ncbi:MAG: 3-isopropylmalate dehydratase small subunit [Bauldia sp.]|nr:MAG: 3-isopropylmalate dehydratase small subunit [Bauldia sp.]
MTADTEQARIHKYGDHIDTDVIVPGKYLNVRDPAELARYCLEGLDPEFSARVRPGDIIVAGRNFGCGSSREHAAMALKATGISCIVAESYARIFYRNALNIGLPVLVCPDFVRAAQGGGVATVDPMAGRIEYGGRQFRTPALPAYVQSIVRAGGMVPFIRSRLAEEAIGRKS